MSLAENCLHTIASNLNEKQLLQLEENIKKEKQRRLDDYNNIIIEKIKSSMDDFNACDCIHIIESKGTFTGYSSYIQTFCFKYNEYTIDIKNVFGGVMGYNPMCKKR